MGRGASHESAQQQFLSIRGMLEMIQIDLEDVLDDVTAELWADALNHRDMYDGEEEITTLDPVFTPKEWEKKNWFNYQKND